MSFESSRFTTAVARRLLAENLMPIRNLIVRYLPVALALSVSGCMVGPDFHRPAINPAMTSFVPSSQSGRSRLVLDAVSPAWWELFHDPLLVSLEQRAAAQNLDLQAALARMGQSRAQLQIAGAQGLPTVGANASDLRERASPNGILQLIGTSSPASATAANGADAFGTAGTAQSTGSAPYSLWQYGLDASWEIDLWGRARRTREAAAASLRSSVYDAQGIKLALAAEVASTYVQLRGLQTTLAMVEANREIAAHGVQITKSREANGVATRFEAASASAELATVSSSIPGLQAQIHVAMNALALLLGENPNALTDELEQAKALPSPPEAVPVGLPSELAQRRPDILEAEENLHAATAEIGIAKADFYPSINLTGSFGLQALQFSDAGHWASRQFAVGPVLNLPIFQGGRLKGTLALTRTRQQESAIRFQKTVLQAWHEVDNALTMFATTQSQVRTQETAVTESEVAYKAAQRRYEEGASGYLAVLIAQRSLLADQQNLVQGRLGVSMAMISLYKALGGGWPGTDTSHDVATHWTRSPAAQAGTR
jgi:NodT family efflux transporter outer membrane factor (OMF) lipoprotein